MVVQVKPFSNMHVCEHPSLSATLPSSHSSPASRFPFPQLAAHAWVVEPVRQTGSLVQVLEQPLPSPLKRPFGPVQPVGKGGVSLVPQSQPSLPVCLPSPQTATVQTLFIPAGGLGQLAPGSIRQFLEQPSPSVLFPSSQASVPMRMPSPHLGVHFLPGTRHT